MWGWLLARALAAPTQGVLVGGGASGDLLAEPAFSTGGSLAFEVGLTPGGDRAAFRTGPVLNAGLSSAEQGRFGFGWSAGAIWGADDAVYQTLLFTGGGALFGTGDLGGFGRADLRWGFPLAGVAALEVGPFAAGWAGEATPFIGQVGVQLTALAWLPLGPGKRWDLPDIDLPDIDLPDIDRPALQPEPAPRQRDGGPLVEGPRDGGTLLEGPKPGGGRGAGPKRGGGPLVDGPRGGGPMVDAPSRGPRAGVPSEGGPRSGGPLAGTPKAGGPKAGAPKAGVPKAGGPKAGAPGEGVRRVDPDPGKKKVPEPAGPANPKKKKKKKKKKSKKADGGASGQRRPVEPAR